MSRQSSNQCGSQSGAMLGAALSDEVEAGRYREVWASLAPVTDPELDESITELGFVTSVKVSGADVQIRFHLPTYWCAANFAFLMASDLYHAARALHWVTSVAVELDDHMYAETINRGIAAGSSFSDTFGDEANDELVELRSRFRQKAFQQRQESLIRYLLNAGHSREEIVTLDIAELDALPAHSDEEHRLLQRYREIRREWGGDASGNCLAFVTIDGNPVSVSRFGAYLIELRSIRLNTQFNGEICRGLLSARYQTDHARPTEVRVDVPSPSARHRFGNTSPAMIPQPSVANAHQPSHFTRSK